MLITNFFATAVIGGEDSKSVTVDINPAPVNAMVTVSIGGVGGDGDVAAGIVEFSVRNKKGQDVTTKFANLNNTGNIGLGTLPIAIGKDNLSHVTMLILTFEGCTSGLMTLFGTDYGESSNP